jgi:hypothetical protein
MHLMSIATLRAALEEREERLAAIYPEHGAAVALVCDEVLDRSGALLGRVRNRALALRAALATVKEAGNA